MSVLEEPSRLATRSQKSWALPPSRTSSAGSTRRWWHWQRPSRGLHTWRRILVLLGACDDGPTTLAKGEDIELVGEDDLGGQTLNINAEEQDGEVTGEFRISNDVITIECADTDTDGVVILGGDVTTSENFEGLHALIIREGDPDSVSLYSNEVDGGSCTELLDSIPPDSLTDDSNFDLLEDGSDIETG
jgi:hypothetical protein